MASGMVWISTETQSGRQSGEALQDFGAVVLLDAAPDTNTLRWRLFTLLVRDSGASWLPAAHFLVSNTSGGVIEAALTDIKRLVPDWKPRFFVTDRLSAEADGIIAFAQVHRLEVSVLASQWHWKRDVEQELAGRHLLECREWIRLALYVSVDEQGCQQYGQMALQAIPAGCQWDEARRYVASLFSGDVARWASFGRFVCRSPGAKGTLCLPYADRG